MSKKVFCARCESEITSGSKCQKCGHNVSRMETPLEARVTALEERFEKAIKILNYYADYYGSGLTDDEISADQTLKQVADALRGDE